MVREDQPTPINSDDNSRKVKYTYKFIFWLELNLEINLRIAGTQFDSKSKLTFKSLLEPCDAIDVGLNWFTQLVGQLNGGIRLLLYSFDSKYLRTA